MAERVLYDTSMVNGLMLRATEQLTLVRETKRAAALLYECETLCINAPASYSQAAYNIYDMALDEISEVMTIVRDAYEGKDADKIRKQSILVSKHAEKIRAHRNKITALYTTRRRRLEKK